MIDQTPHIAPISLNSTTALTSPMQHGLRMGPTERRMGRFMRAPDEHDSSGGGDNQGGNQSATNNDSQRQDNSGTGFDPSTFWDESGGQPNGSPRGGESTESGRQPSGSQGNQGQQPNQQQENPAQNLMTQLQGLNFGNSVMTDKAIADLAEGNTESFHKGLNDFGRNVAQQTLKMSLGIMAQVRDQMFETMRAEFQGTLTNKDNDSALLKAIPSAKDPKVRPIVDNIYKRALQISKGDSAAAIDMTKQMMRLTAETTGEDIGIPPRGRGDNFDNPSNTDWLSELAGR